MLRQITFAIMLPGLLFFAGCSGYVDGYEYTPRPALEVVPPKLPDQPPPVEAMASIVGVRYSDSRSDLPACVEVHLRLDNNGPQTIRFDPRTMNLINGDLWRFPAVIVRPSDVVTLDPNDEAMVIAFFPFPPGLDWDHVDMESLQLRWAEQIGNETAGQTAYFHRIYHVYYGPYWDYPYPYPYFGGVIVIHGHFRR
jgi:hypothetical protein